jgi:hypothetical protein
MMYEQLGVHKRHKWVFNSPISLSQSEVMDAVREEEGIYMEMGEPIDEDEGVGLEDGGDNRLAYWAWTGEEEDADWEVEDDADSIVLNLNLTEDEDEETWE